MTALDVAKFTSLGPKIEANEMLLKYKVAIENQLDRKIKRLRSDRGE